MTNEERFEEWLRDETKKNYMTVGNLLPSTVEWCKSAFLAACPQWQPIETAPVDGTVHLRGLFVHTSYPAGGGSDTFEVYQGYIADNGAFDTVTGEYCGWDADDFTHWLPLPPPPEWK